MDRALAEYRRKRDFERTPEPAPQRKRKRAGFSFTVQKHAASRLHYDFRLELDGVLLSWAVPKGPSLDPHVKRLAMQTEDHPIEYGTFEGVIPKGEYGGGPVLVWDHGHWTPEGDPREAYRRGRLTFELHGDKLRGRWHLVRTRGERGRSWLLFKSNDREARKGKQAEIVAALPQSVLSGREIDDIRREPDKVWHSNKPRIRLTHPDRVLYAEQGLTKRDLALYYAQVAPYMLPHVARRPLMLVRCPEGHDKECFHQKHPGNGVPDSVGRVPIRERNVTRQYMYVEDAIGLVSLVQVGALEIHSWGSRIDRLEYPDQLVFDLDPDEGLPLPRLIDAAHELRARLAAIGLTGFVKTTGGKGLHVVVPVEPRTKWDDAKQFSKALVQSMVRAEPRRYLATMSKAKRKGKIFLDYLRNGRGSTAVCAYSTRARSGAPVALPIAWDELDAELRARDFDLRSTPARLAGLQRDPWRDFAAARAPIGKAARRSVGLR
jgi:bifunctional non-homologous end joining protein LigD